MKTGVSSRVINQVKAGLHTCSELIVWINSIKSKYVLTQTAKIVTFCPIFVSLFFGTSIFMVDVSTDLIVNSEWRYFASTEFSSSLICETLNTSSTETALVEIMKICVNTTDSLEGFLTALLKENKC